jgi:uncharacterized protein YjbJ (UPF0337 family)
MSEPNNVDVAYNKAMESVKGDFGYITGNIELEAKERIQNKESETERATAETKGNTEGTNDSTSGTAKNTTDSLTGESTQ